MKYFVGFLVIIALGLAGFVASSKNTLEDSGSDTKEIKAVEETGIEHSIILTEAGYEPDEITVSAGDKIVFSASPEYERLHWPASNLHPTHSVYSGFDPLKPVESTETWSFVFGRVGEWRFHDHLAPYHTGVITVE